MRGLIRLLTFDIVDLLNIGIDMIENRKNELKADKLKKIRQMERDLEKLNEMLDKF